ncbi:MAG: hypothetical protein M1816_001496 [Peltula sp. TS41687]|nr:MAG: hypothetical protein M1816_001496 [Peltula sp. TS41687]
MAKRRTKKRTHVGARNPAGQGAGKASAGGRSPKSMVLRIGAGEVGPSVSQLVKDVRAMMEPDTASRLKERRANRLKDYLTMAGPLGVTHLLLFSRSSTGNTNLRIALTPRGPTFHFKVDSYSLCKDVKKSMKHPKGGGKEYLTAPLLVMNNFMSQTQPDTPSQPSAPKHLESLVTSVFQSLFPPIAPQTTPLSSIRRVLLLNRETGTSNTQEDLGSYVINLRHYAITTRLSGISKGIRRLNAAEKLIRSREKKAKGLPNLGKLEDVADYLLDPSAAAGYTSMSESEVETDAEVEVLETPARKVLSSQKREQQRAQRANGGSSGKKPAVEKRAVKLAELGPRMKLRLVKVEEGVCGGRVMWHEFINKTKAEVQEMDKLWDDRRKQKEERKRQQQDNVARKRSAKGEGEEGEGEEEMGADEDEWDDADLEAVEDMDVDEEEEEEEEVDDEEEEEE